MSSTVFAVELFIVPLLSEHDGMYRRVSFITIQLANFWLIVILWIHPTSGIKTSRQLWSPSARLSLAAILWITMSAVNTVIPSTVHTVEGAMANQVAKQSVRPSVHPSSMSG
ncbi:hypothetical protein P692DRAFT_20881778 [Suillus brevipes Sb2]|nr:hypothetical protein P692DRAFT_20881778 [Suillus brevipes Sb2]